MLYTWKIFYGDNFLGYAYSETGRGACDQALHRGGCASLMNIERSDISYERVGTVTND